MVREGYKETEIGEIPVEWEVKSFSEACGRLLNGGTPNTQVPKYWDGSIPWITGADVVNQKIENIRRYITEKAVEDSSTSVIPKECLLVVTRTGVGKLAITPFDVAISQDITGVIPKTDYDIEYLFWVLNASRNYFQNLTQGTSINGITRNDLTQFKFAVPPLPEQRRIAAVLSTIDEAMATEQLRSFLMKYVSARKALMCGNSICQDRRFMANYMPKLEDFFHYRNVDVSTLKELARRWKPGLVDGFKKAQKHTALADIHESIDELLYYREHFLAA